MALCKLGSCQKEGAEENGLCESCKEIVGERGEFGKIDRENEGEWIHRAGLSFVPFSDMNGEVLQRLHGGS